MFVTGPHTVVVLLVVVCRSSGSDSSVVVVVVVVSSSGSSAVWGLIQACSVHSSVARVGNNQQTCIFVAQRVRNCHCIC